MGTIFIVVLYFGYAFLTYKIGIIYWRRSRGYRSVPQIVGRTVFLPFFWGVGFFGVEGFGFLGPLVPCTLLTIIAPSASSYGVTAGTWTSNVAIALFVSLAVAFVNRYRPGSASTELPEVTVIDAPYSAADHLAGGLLPSRSSKHVPAEFEVLKNRVLNVANNDELPIQLNKLRSFLNANDLAGHRQVRDFYTKWLTHMNVSAGVAVPSAYSSREAKELKGDLWRVQL
jgi:hypothetical protein